MLDKPQAKTAPDLDTIANDLATLRQDFATLMADLRDGTVNHARGMANGAAGHITEKANNLYGHADAKVKALSHEVEERPLTALMVAFGIGFVASRVLLR